MQSLDAPLPALHNLAERFSVAGQNTLYDLFVARSRLHANPFRNYSDDRLSQLSPDCLDAIHWV
jgi:hypothetical protein